MPSWWSGNITCSIAEVTKHAHLLAEINEHNPASTLALFALTGKHPSNCFLLFCSFDMCARFKVLHLSFWASRLPCFHKDSDQIKLFQKENHRNNSGCNLNSQTLNVRNKRRLIQLYKANEWRAHGSKIKSCDRCSSMKWFFKVNTINYWSDELRHDDEWKLALK